MQIIPSVKEKSNESVSLSLPLEVNIDRDLILEINNLFEKTIFKFGENGLSFIKNDSEGYVIDFKNNKIEFNTYKDKVNSLFSIAQYSFNYGKIPLFIKDNASFKWLGLNIDIARTFFNKNELKRLMLIYASLKYNKIHIHLTDDQGWRIEIKKYPTLTNGEKYLSQEDIKELIRYADLLGMDIIPEFGIPGHTRALISKIDHLTCNDKKVFKWNEFGVSSEVMCLSNPKSLEVVLNIYKEIASLFPYSKIHVGGDECPTISWENCKLCKEKCKGDKSVYDLQKEFMQKIVNEIKNNFNKDVILWDDIQEHNEFQNVTIGFWRSWCLNKDKDYLNKIAKNNNLIISPVNRMYLDWTNNSDDNETIKMDKGWTTSFKKTLSFNPLDGINKEFHKKVLGSEVSLWTEKINNFDRLIYQAFPRSFAAIEVLWGNRNDFEELKDKIENSKYVELVVPTRYKGSLE